MADNEGRGSANPKTKSTNDITETAATDNAAAEENESQNLDGVAAPQSKRRKTSAANAHQDTVSEQSDVSRNNEPSASVGPGQQPIYQGNVSDLVASELLRQQHEAAQNNIQSSYGQPSAQGLMSPNTTATLMMANQLRLTGETVPLFQNTQVQSNNDLQQLSLLLQQHLYNFGLAQSLGMNLQSSQGAVGGLLPNSIPSFAHSTLTLPVGSATNPNSFHATLPATTIGNTTANSISEFFLSANRRNDDSVTPTHHSKDAAPQNESRGGVTGRSPLPLYITCDTDSLSEYQCLVRKHIELFEATVEDVESNAQGRNRPIVLGQVGIRCRHCTMLPPRHRSRGAIYYPSKLPGIYQAAQNLAVAHLGEHCQNVPDNLRAKLIQLRERKSAAGCGKRYWANGVRVLGVVEDSDGLRFETTIPTFNDANNK